MPSLRRFGSANHKITPVIDASRISSALASITHRHGSPASRPRCKSLIRPANPNDLISTSVLPSARSIVASHTRPGPLNTTWNFSSSLSKSVIAPLTPIWLRKCSTIRSLSSPFTISTGVVPETLRVRGVVAPNQSSWLTVKPVTAKKSISPRAAIVR